MSSDAQRVVVAGKEKLDERPLEQAFGAPAPPVQSVHPGPFYDTRSVTNTRDCFRRSPSPM